MSNSFYIDVHEDTKNNKIVCWMEDNDGIYKEEQDLDDYLFAFQPSNKDDGEGYIDIHGNPLKKSNFRNKWDYNDFVKQRDDLCASDVNAESKYILWNFYDREDFNAPATIMFYDIEVEVDLKQNRGYPSVADPFGAICAISMYHSKHKSYIMLIPQEYSNVELVDEYENLPVEVVFTRNEKEMLEIFAELLDDVAVLTGWNSSSFDLPYIIARAKIIFGERKALSMFCRDGYAASKREFTNNFGNDEVVYTLVGRNEIDMLQVYKKIKMGEKPSFSLSAIAVEELGIDKIEYDDDLGELLKNDPQRFFEYSLHDARLLKMLEDKLRLIWLALYMSRSSCAKLPDFLGTVKMGEHALQKFALKKNIILPDRKDAESEDFDGALVYCTDKGRTGYTFSIDLNALYVRIMLILGVSSETLLMYYEGGLSSYVEIMNKTKTPIIIKLIADGSIHHIPAYEIEELIRENGYIIAPNGAIFSGELGLFAQLVTFYNDSRNIYKAKMKQATTPEEEELYNLIQLAWKLLGNSAYGTIGNKAFKLYDVRIAGAITSVARLIAKYQNATSDILVKEVFN